MHEGFREWRRSHPPIMGADEAAPQMRTVSEFEERQSAIRSLLKEIDNSFAGQIMPESARGQWNTLNEELERNDDVLAELRAREDRLREIADQDGSLERGAAQARRNRPAVSDIYDVAAIRMTATSPADFTKLMSENAQRAIDKARFPHPDVNREDAQEHMVGLLEKFRAADDDYGSEQVDIYARRVLYTGSETYRRAWSKAVAGKALNAEEQRALSLTNTAGGYAVPFTLDPTIVPTSNLSVNPYRAISRQETIATTTWQGVTSDGVTAAYQAEVAEVGDNAPTLAQPTATPARCDVFVPFSIEIGQDWGGIQAQMATLVQDAKDDIEATKFTTGSGTNEPQGVQTGATTVVTGAGTGTFALADLYSLEQALGPRFRPRAQFIGNRAIYNLIRQFDTGGGGGLWLQVAPLGTGLSNQVPRPGNIGAELLGYGANEVSAYTSSVATSGLILTLGDFRYFLIVDRIGMDVELVPHLFGTNRRPVGQRGLLFFWRNTSVVLSANAFRTLKVK